MHSDKTRAALMDIGHNILAARRFIADLSFDDFQRSDLHYYAVVRALEIISKAARRLPSQFRGKHPELPRNKIMGIGNVLLHNYDDVVERIVWATVTDFLNKLHTFVEAELTVNDRPPDSIAD